MLWHTWNAKLKPAWNVATTHCCTVPFPKGRISDPDGVTAVRHRKVGTYY